MGLKVRKRPIVLKVGEDSLMRFMERALSHGLIVKARSRPTSSLIVSKFTIELIDPLKGDICLKSDNDIYAILHYMETQLQLYVKNKEFE